METDGKNGGSDDTNEHPNMNQTSKPKSQTEFDLRPMTLNDVRRENRNKKQCPIAFGIGITT